MRSNDPVFADYSGKSAANDNRIADENNVKEEEVAVVGANISADKVAAQAAPSTSCEQEAFQDEPAAERKCSQRVSRSRSRERDGVWIQHGSRTWRIKLFDW